MTHFINQHKFILAIFLLLSFFTIIKVFYLPDCFAFDANDDRNHTFVNLFAVKNILKTGELPQINFFNNFGTPILGDGITYPFAIQALPYYFLSGPVAMTLNRFALTFLTLLALYIFFKSYFKKLIAVILAIFVFYAPGFLWHFAHYHYQASLLFFVVSLVLLRKLGQNLLSSKKFLILFFATQVLFIFSASINVVLIALPMLLLSSVFFINNNHKKIVPALIISLISVISAVIATLPQNLSFLKEIASSNRISSTYIFGTDYVNYNIFRVILGMFAQVLPGTGHISAALYLSLPIFFAVIIGGFYLFKENKKMGLMFLVLGFLPLISILLLLSFPVLWSRIPLLKSIDITRVWWFSNVFLSIGLGVFLEKFINLQISKKILICALIFTIIATTVLVLWQKLCSLGIILFGRCSAQNVILPIYQWNMILFGALLLFYIILNKKNNLIDKEKQTRLLMLLTIFVFIFSIIPTPLFIFNIKNPQCDGSHWFGSKKYSEFQPSQFLKLMEPDYRVATEIISSYGQDLAAIFNNVLGSNGRSIIMDKKFTDYLWQNNLIEIDDRLSGYHFKRPFQVQKLEKLGIRYIIANTRALELEKANWKKLGEKDGLILYDNQKKPTLFYLLSDKKIQYIYDYKFYGNSAIIHLPKLEKEKKFVATFISRPGWKVKVNGVTRQYKTDIDNLIRINVYSNDEIIELSYSLVSWLQFFGWFLAGIIIVAIASFFIKTLNI